MRQAARRAREDCAGRTATAPTRSRPPALASSPAKRIWCARSCGALPRARSRRHHRLERDRLRSRVPAGARRGARHPVRDRPRPRRDATLLDARSLQRWRLLRPGGDPGSRRPRRHPAPARRLHPHGELLARLRVAQGGGRRQDHRGARSRRRDPAHLGGGPRGVRPLQPARRHAGARDPREARSGAARGRAHAAHRHAARSRLGERRVVRLPLPLGALEARARGAQRRRLRGRVGRLRRHRAAARARPLRQRAGVRLQEPLPLDHPHLRDRSAGLSRLGARAASRTR